MLRDCTEARKANFSLSDVVDVSFDIDKRTIVNNEIVSILQHCGDDGQERTDVYEQCTSSVRVSERNRSTFPKMFSRVFCLYSSMSTFKRS
jgi:hypothetical protein